MVSVMNSFGQKLRSGVQVSCDTSGLAKTPCRSARHQPCRLHAVQASSAGVAGGNSQRQDTPDFSDARLLERLERLYHLSPLHPLSYNGSEHQQSISDPLWSHGIFSVSVDDKPPQTKKGSQEKCPDYYANVGDAIRTLRDDIPHLFERELNCKWLAGSSTLEQLSVPDAQSIICLFAVDIDCSCDRSYCSCLGMPYACP